MATAQGAHVNLFVRIMLVLCCALVPAIGVALYNESVLRQEREAEIRSEALRAAVGVSDEISRIVDAVGNLLVPLAELDRLPLNNATDCGARLADIASAAAYLADLRI